MSEKSAMKTIRLKRPDGSLLNGVADFILEELAEFAERVPVFELVEGAAALMGSGDHAIIEIVIRYDDASGDDLEAIKAILERAQKGADEVSVDVIEE